MNTNNVDNVNKSFDDRVAEAEAEMPTITVAAAYERHQNDPETLFVDPRPAEAIARTTGIVPGALNVTLARLDGTDELPEAMASTSRPIIAVCQLGHTGAVAAHALKRRGFTRVSYMEGGTQAWLDAGYPTNR